MVMSRNTAARRIQRMFRARRKRRLPAKMRRGKRQKVGRGPAAYARGFYLPNMAAGFRPRAGTCKRRLITNTNLASGSTRILNTIIVTDIPKQTSLLEIDRRERAIIDFKGFRLVWELRNLLEDPLLFNMAVLIPRSGVAGITTAEFFRDDVNDRGQNFATGLNSNEFHLLPINTDIYNVVKHERLKIGGTSNDTRNGGHKIVKRYIPVNKQIRYFDGSGTATTPIYVVWWCDKSMTAAGTVGTSDSISTSFNTIAIFKDIV